MSKHIVEDIGFVECPYCNKQCKLLHCKHGVKKRISGTKGYKLFKQMSVPQTKLYELVGEIFPYTKLEYEIFSYFLDIAIPEFKLCIEYGVTFRHESNKYHPNKEEHDKVREKIITSLGWKVLTYMDQVPTEEKLIEDIRNILNYKI